VPDLSNHVGRWTGTWSTWLRPGELHDESAIDAEVVAADGGWKVEYTGRIADDVVTGRMVVSTDGERIDWNDSWHTAGEDQHLAAAGGSMPAYDYGPDDAPWTWSIAIDPGPDSLTVTHHNRPPGGEAAVAVVMQLARPDA
jgi:hypothetical protein